MDTGTNGFADYKKDGDNSHQSSDKSEKIDISRNLRRVDSESLNSARSHENQDIKYSNKSLNNNERKEKSGQNASRPVEDPSVRSPKYSYSKDNKERKSSNSAISNRENDFVKAVKTSKRATQAVNEKTIGDKTIKSRSSNKGKDDRENNKADKEKKIYSNSENRNTAEETTKRFSAEEMRQIQVAETKERVIVQDEDEGVKSKTGFSNFSKRNETKGRSAEKNKKDKLEDFDDIEKSDSEKHYDSQETDEKDPSKFALAMSNFGQGFNNWIKAQTEKFKIWYTNKKEVLAQRKIEKELERERLKQEREKTIAEAEKLAKATNERALQEQAEQEEWSWLLGIEEKQGENAYRIKQAENDDEVGAREHKTNAELENDISIYNQADSSYKQDKSYNKKLAQINNDDQKARKNIDKHINKDIDKESGSEKLFMEYRQKQLSNPKNAQDYYVSNTANNANINNKEDSRSSWVKKLRNGGHGIRYRFNEFRNEISKKSEHEASSLGTGKQGFGVKVKHGFEYLFIRLQTKHLVLIGIGFIALLVLIFYLLFRSPISEFKDALARRNYQEAGQAYEKYLGNNKKTSAAEEELTNYIAQLRDNTINGSTSFAATYSVLETMKSTPLNQGNAQAIIDRSMEEILNLQEVNRYYESAVSSLESMDSKSAIINFNRVADLVPGYKETNKYLAQAKSNYREEVLKRVNTLQSQGKYTEVDRAIDEGLELLPEDPVLLRTKEANMIEAESSLSKEVKEQAERFFRAGKFNELFKSIDDALRTSANDESIENLKEEYETKYAESIIKTADSLFKQDSKGSALEKIDEGLKILPNNSLLQRAKNRYEFNLDATDEEINILKKNENKDPDNVEKDKEEENETADEQATDDGLVRANHVDVAGNQHRDAVLLNHSFDGDTSAIEQQQFDNVNGKRLFTGEIAIGEINASTQIYYQIYASSNLATPLYSGSLFADPNNSGSNYSVSVNAPSSGESYFVVNINYLAGKDINVILDLSYE